MSAATPECPGTVRVRAVPGSSQSAHSHDHAAHTQCQRSDDQHWHHRQQRHHPSSRAPHVTSSSCRCCCRFASAPIRSARMPERATGLRSVRYHRVRAGATRNSMLGGCSSTARSRSSGGVIARCCSLLLAPHHRSAVSAAVAGGSAKRNHCGGKQAAGLTRARTKLHQ